MPSKGTPLRNVRVPDDLWGRAQARAAQEQTSVSAVLVWALTAYADGHLTPKQRTPPVR